MLTSITYLIFRLQLMFTFRILMSRKARFTHLSISIYVLCTKDFRVFGGQYFGYRTVIKAKTSFYVGSILQICKFEIPIFIYKFIPSFLLPHYSYWNLGNILTFMCSPPNDKYNLSYPKTQHSWKRKLHNWFLCFLDVHFSRFEELKITFLTSFHFALWIMH